MALSCLVIAWLRQYTCECRPVVSAVNVATDPSSGPHLTDLLEDNSWKPHLADEFQKPYFHKLEKFIKHEWATQQVFPTSPQIFR